MHFALLIGYGASAINPYLAIETLHDLKRRGLLPHNVTPNHAEKNFIKAINKGLLKTFSKMGIQHAAELSRRAGLRSRRAESRLWSKPTSPAPHRASKASGSTCWRAKRR